MRSHWTAPPFTSWFVRITGKLITQELWLFIPAPGYWSWHAVSNLKKSSWTAEQCEVQTFMPEINFFFFSRYKNSPIHQVLKAKNTFPRALVSTHPLKRRKTTRKEFFGRRKKILQGYAANIWCLAKTSRLHWCARNLVEEKYIKE